MGLQGVIWLVAKKLNFEFQNFKNDDFLDFSFNNLVSFTFFISDLENSFKNHVEIKIFDATISTQKLRFYGAKVDFPKFKWNRF